LPRLSVAGGRVEALFYDRRNDPGNVMNDVYLATSPDGGASFGPNLRVNRESFSSQIGTRYPIPSAVGLVEYGSRIAVLAEPGRTLAAWTDTRNQDIDGFGQDIFATEVDRGGVVESGGDGASGWLLPAVLVTGAVLLVAAGVGVAARRKVRRPGTPSSSP
jgi:hypothetical protein